MDNPTTYRAEIELHERAARLLKATGARNLNAVMAMLRSDPGALGDHRDEAVALLSDLAAWFSNSKGADDRGPSGE